MSAALIDAVVSRLTAAAAAGLSSCLHCVARQPMGSVVAVAILAALLLWWSTRFEPFPFTPSARREPTVALFAGSLNPPHRGHLAIIEHLASKHETLYVVIGVNRSKSYLVSPAERKELVQSMCAAAHLDNVIVEVTSDYIWRLAIKVKGAVLYKGIRTWRKDGPPERWLELLNLVGPPLLAPLGWPLRTSYLQADARYAHVSSSLVRSRCQNQSEAPSIADLVPTAIEEKVRAAYGVRGGRARDVR